jgi:hypothetical protein
MFYNIFTNECAHRAKKSQEIFKKTRNGEKDA